MNQGWFCLLALLSLLSQVQYVVSQNIAWASVPTAISIGDTFNLVWTGGDGSPVTITLRKGKSSNLKTIAVLANGISGNSYSWTVSNVEVDDNYWLELAQGSGVNYSNSFSISGSSSAITSAVSSSSSSSFMSSASTAAASQGSSATATIPSSTSPTTQASVTGSASSSQSSVAVNTTPGDGLSGGAIAGIVIGVIGVIALIVIAVMLILRRKKASQNSYASKRSAEEGVADSEQSELVAGISANRHELKQDTKTRHELDGRSHRHEIDSGAVHEKGIDALSQHGNKA